MKVPLLCSSHSLKSRKTTQAAGNAKRPAQPPSATLTVSGTRVLSLGLQTNLHRGKVTEARQWEGHMTCHVQGWNYTLAVTFSGSGKNSFKNMSWQEVRQAKPQFGKTNHILLAAYVVGMSLQNNQILFLLKTNKTTATATRPLGTWLHG